MKTGKTGSDDVLISITIVQLSKLPPILPNRNNLLEKITKYQSQPSKWKSGIPEKQYIHAFSSTWLKIEFAKKSFQQLKKIARTIFLVNNKPHYAKIGVNLTNYFRFLRELDSFLFELYGSLDYFSKEMSLALHLGIEDHECGIVKVMRTLKGRDSDYDVRSVTFNMLQSEWFTYFGNVRNRLAHRNALLVGVRKDELFFPDDPWALEIASQEKQLEVLGNCRLWLRESLKYIDEVSSCLGKRLFHEL
jgi:hypothetical protein